MTEVASPPRTLLAAFAVRLAADPDATMVSTLGERLLSYRTVGGRAAALAARLRRLGVGEGSRVALRVDNNDSWIVASLAVWSLGASVVVLGRLLAGTELRRLVAVAAPRVLIGTPQDDAMASLDIDVIAVDDDAAAERAGALDHGAARPEAEACVFCTSGTTGQPKLVVHTHANLASVAAQMSAVYPKTPGFRPTAAPANTAPGVIFSPFGHVAGYHAWAFRLWIGRSVVLVPRFSLAALRQVLGRYRLDALQLVPAMIYEIVNAPEPLNLGGVRYVTAGTAPLGEHVRRAFEARFGIPILATYGSTEVGPVAHVRYADVVSGRHPAGSVGRPGPDVEVRICGPDGQVLPAGEVGAIEIRKRNLGQLVNSADTRRDGFLATGDSGRLDDDGFLFVTGRINDKLVVGGFNVYPAEIENAATQLPSVRDCLVVGAPDERLGEIPVAGVVWSGAADEAALVAHLRGQLAHYKVPRAFASLPALPLTARGKVDRAAARQEILAQVGSRHKGTP